MIIQPRLLPCLSVPKVDLNIRVDRLGRVLQPRFLPCHSTPNIELNIRIET